MSSLSMLQSVISFPKIKAWGVHLYTASGLVLAAGIAVKIIEGTKESFYWAFALMWLATFIDATDGFLARRFEVSQWAPEFDGRRLDDLTDFLTYTCLPLLLIWRGGFVGDYASWLVFPLVASAYGFCQVSAKTEDGYFLGFPSYWNLVALYLFLLDFSATAAIVLIMTLAFLTFIPFRYLYSTQPGKLNLYTNYFAGVWGVQLVHILYLGIQGEKTDSIGRLSYYSLAFPAYYMITSWIMTWKMNQREKQ